MTPDSTTTFGQPPGTWLDDTNHAAALLDAYLNYNLYSGALWDPATARRRTPDTCDVIDVEDLYAPTLLSAPIRRTAGKAIIERAGVVTGHLRQIKTTTALWDAESPDLKQALGHARELLTDLMTIPHIGATKASKLVAAKRPDLIPIWDSQVTSALKASPKMSWDIFWSDWKTALDPDTVAALRVLAKEAGKPDLPPLRTADIIIWMAEWGWSFLPKSDWADLRRECKSRKR